MSKLAISLAAIMMATAWAGAQPPDDGPRGPEGPRGWREPGRAPDGGPFLLLEALDVDGDGVISAEEIGQASESLLRLDRNGDGELRRNEWMPRPAGGERRPGPGFGEGRRGPPEGGERAQRGRRFQRDRAERLLDSMTAPPRGENQPPLGSRLADRVMQFDEDGDGRLSPDEIPERLLPMMERADANEDGMIDREELLAVAERMRERFREGRERPARPRRPLEAEADPADPQS